ncbi:hypothetical protein P3T35_007404 [Kitasatospora sp. GP30]|nr:hypothetical protein [Kitasatospora sp. GP30]
MQCGAQTSSGATECRRGDASTNGAVMLSGVTDIHQAGAIALQFRNAAEH